MCECNHISEKGLNMLFENAWKKIDELEDKIKDLEKYKHGHSVE